jgi:hypothetical protein
MPRLSSTRLPRDELEFWEPQLEVFRDLPF